MEELVPGVVIESENVVAGDLVLVVRAADQTDPKAVELLNDVNVKQAAYNRRLKHGMFSAGFNKDHLLQMENGVLCRRFVLKCSL